MIKRDEVVALAELANDPTISSMRLMLVNPETVRQLARTWLAVDGAEETACGDCDDGVYKGQPCEYCKGRGYFLLVVPEADSGGEG